jgi:hypothetical protein
LVDGKKKGQITQNKNLSKIEDLQVLLDTFKLDIGDTIIHPFSR